MIRILVVDDEASARSKVIHFLRAHEDCEVVGEAATGLEAVRQMAALLPDLVFLDINMPECDGFEALACLPLATRPQVIFATAYDDRAIKAFEVQALDYLLKPFDRARFDASLERARKRVTAVTASHGVQHDVFDQLRGLFPERQYPKQLLVQDGASMRVVDVNKIDYIESAANYVVLHVAKQRHIMRTTLMQLERQLDPRAFCRVHRQYLVRVAAIRELESWPKGDMQLRLHSGMHIRASRNYKKNLLAAFSPSNQP